jgi:hypothetical protein
MENSRPAEADRLLEQGNEQYQSEQFESALSFVCEFYDLRDDKNGQDFTGAAFLSLNSSNKKSATILSRFSSVKIGTCTKIH